MYLRNHYLYKYRALEFNLANPDIKVFVQHHFFSYTRSCKFVQHTDSYVCAYLINLLAWLRSRVSWRRCACVRSGMRLRNGRTASSFKRVAHFTFSIYKEMGCHRARRRFYLSPRALTTATLSIWMWGERLKTASGWHNEQNRFKHGHEQEKTCPRKPGNSELNTQITITAVLVKVTSLCT